MGMRVQPFRDSSGRRFTDWAGSRAAAIRQSKIMRANNMPPY
jgi:hypothetical protein